MSRVGKLPVEILDGVNVAISGREVQVEGPAGKMSFTVGADIQVAQENGCLQVTRSSNSRQARADHGTARALLANMVRGVKEKWVRKLEFNGVGFGATVQGNKLVIRAGYSHQPELQIPEGIDCKAGKTDLEMACCDRQKLGEFAARVRSVHKPEPYLGKGIRYSEPAEIVRRKAGKTGK